MILDFLSLVLRGVAYIAHSQDWLCYWRSERVRRWYQTVMRIMETTRIRAETAPDFERQSVFAAIEEKGDGNFVHGESEDEQCGGDKRKFQIGESDEPESAPGSGAEVERGFFLTAIHFLQAGEDFGGGYGDESGAVAEKNGD